VKHDVPVTFLIVLAYLAYDRLWRRGDLPSLLAAAAITGAAFSTHDYAIFLAIPLAWSAARGARNTGDAIRRIAVAAVVSGAVFFLLSPYIRRARHGAPRHPRPASRYLVPVVPFMTLFAALAPAELWRQTRGVNVGQLLFVAAFVAAALECQRTIFFIRQTDTRTLALQYFQEHVPSAPRS
jgi:hypothetical protein